MKNWLKKTSGVVILFAALLTTCSQEVIDPWKQNKYFAIAKNSMDVKKLYAPDGKEFYMRGIVYAPLEGKGPDFLGDLYGELSLEDYNKYMESPNAPPVRNSLSGLREDLEIIHKAGFNQIKLWNVIGLSRLGLLKPFLLAAAEKKIGVMLALTGPNDGWQLSADPKKLAIFSSALSKITREVKSINSVISINIYAPEIRDNYPTEKTKEIIGVFANAVKSFDSQRLVAVFIDRDPLFFKFPKNWTSNIDMIGIQPYSIQENALDTARINNDYNYYKSNDNGAPVFIDEWGLRTQSAVGSHSLVGPEIIDKRLSEFLNHAESLQTIGWSYFMLRDKVWEGDFGILKYNSNKMEKKSTYLTIHKHLQKANK